MSLGSNRTINIAGELLSFDPPMVMGVINVTPDSFFVESRKTALVDILKDAENMLEEGAAIIDIGGYSSRPGATDISIEEEIRRIEKPILQLAKEFPNAVISIDTFRSEVASAAVGHGAKMINDISAGNLDQKMLPTVSSLKVPYIGMHMKGTPQTMKDMAQYEDVLIDVRKYFSKLKAECVRQGINDLIIDPGFGFAKTPPHGFELLSKLELLDALDCPVLIGVSRKSMIYKTLEIDAANSLNGTTVLNTIALLKGASILRVHDVRPAVEAIKLVQQLR
ncbi:MAG: dihydropteroate synthase [Bacteroidota bacterium]